MAAYYVGYMFHNPEAIKALQNIQKELWIDWPTNDRMVLRQFDDGLILCTECDVYPARARLDRVEVSLDLDAKHFPTRIKRDTQRLIKAIDALNAAEVPSLRLPGDPRDGVRLFVYTGD
jgi:hypothetical protein